MKKNIVTLLASHLARKKMYGLTLNPSHFYHLWTSSQATPSKVCPEKRRRKKGKRNVHKQVENGCQLVYSISSKLHQFIVAKIFLLHTCL